MEQEELSFIAGGNGADTLEDSFAVSDKAKIIFLPYDPVIALLGIYPNEVKTCIYTKPAYEYL